MHTHFGSATHLAATFLGVLVAGTFWRVGALTLVSSRNPTLANVGKGMLIQF